MSKLEAVLWSIALPGLAQILNGELIKGILFVLLEILINIQGNFNEVIMLSFLGDIEKAIKHTNYQWLLFYPCLYFFAMWDAYRDANGECNKNDFLLFVFSAYSVTVGCFYSSTFKLFGVLLGPVWLPTLCVIPGLVIGEVVRKTILNRENKTAE